MAEFELVDVAAALLDVAAGLRAVVAAVDAGSLEATGAERAYLAGAVEALERLIPAGAVRDTDV